MPTLCNNDLGTWHKEISKLPEGHGAFETHTEKLVNVENARRKTFSELR